MDYRVTCPGCGKLLRFAETEAGRMSICFACGASVQIPSGEPEVHEELPASDVLPLRPSPDPELDEIPDWPVPPRAPVAPPREEPPPAPVQPVSPQSYQTPLMRAVMAGGGGAAGASTSGASLPPTVPPPAVIPPPLAPAAPLPEAQHKHHFYMALSAAVGFLLALCLVALIALFTSGSGDKGWVAENHDAIMRMADEADQLAIQGKPQEAYEKYREIEQFIGNHKIDGDPELKQRLDDVHQRRDEMFKLSATAAWQRRKPRPAIVPVYHPGPTTNSTTGPAVTVARLATRHPPVHKASLPAPAITDEQIGEAIQRTQNFLISKFKDGALDPRTDSRMAQQGVGEDALAVYALLQSGQAVRDERLRPQGQFVQQILEALRKMPIPDDYPTATYSRALRASALALSSRPEDRGQLRIDVAWLLRAVHGGAYTYNIPSGDWWDNSNSQYGLLGVWAGAEAEDPADKKALEIPDVYWQLVERHWATTQLPTGEWSYRQGEVVGRDNMTLAGIVSLFVTHDYIDAPQFGEQVGREPFTPPLAKGLAWLESGDHVSHIGGGYGLYGLERVGLASGFKYFGNHDWYREMAAGILSRQKPDGSFEGQYGNWSVPLVAETSFDLLFLSRGRHPVMMSKLRYDGDWANRPRDVANLARFASRELERPINWQVVPIDHPWQDWADAPILYLAGDKAPELSDAQRDNIRQFVLNGGLLLTQADGDSPEFTQFATQLGKDLFAPYDWQDLPPEHPIYSSFYKLDPGNGRLRAISNGDRVLMVHLPVDVSHYWQLRSEAAQLAAFRLGVNLFVYAAGRTEMRNRVDSPYIAPVVTVPEASITLARLRYGGNWNPEPAAWPRLANYFQNQTSLGVKLTDVPIAQLTVESAPLAHLTGTGRFQPTADEQSALTNYVRSGGVLLIDPCGGPGQFLDDVTAFLASAFAEDSPHRLGFDEPPLAGQRDGGENVQAMPLREFRRTNQPPEETVPRLLRAGKGAVILCPVDLTNALLGTHTWGIAGYEPQPALTFAENVILWAWDGAKSE